MEAFSQIRDRRSAGTIRELTDRMVEQVRPEKVFLFGSFAEGSDTPESDYDFYLVVSDDADPWDARARARRAVRPVQDRPVDIVVGTNSRFEKYGPSPDTFFIEGEVFRKGLLLYDRAKGAQ